MAVSFPEHVAVSSRISRQAFELIVIRQRIELDPEATATEIVSSLKRDGVDVSSERVQQVIDQARRTKKPNDSLCFHKK